MGHKQVWNVPYARNPVFTGREQLLAQIAEALQRNNAAALSQPQAISGLGGVGKTQIAVEYAYQHREAYEAVLWSRADDREALLSGYAEMARVLHLPQQNEQEQSLIVAAVLQWLKTQSRWLLILDNADELEIVREFLPTPLSGHILLTTRAQAMGKLAKKVEVETMNTETGALLLLRRAGLMAQNAPLEAASPSDMALAKAMAQELGGLPLALDQAGAYIEEIPCSLSEYQALYRQHKTHLFKKRRGLVRDHPEPVTTTWSLSFQKVEQQHPAAADLLRFFAFLAPDAIPEEIIVAGAAYLGPLMQPFGEDLLAFHEALATLGRYSLIRREPSTNTVSVHRLVQAVLQDTLEHEVQRTWAERVVLTVNAVFPRAEHATWPQCERLLSQALVASQWIEQYRIFDEDAARLLYETASYFRGRARYQEAEPLFQHALRIREQRLGPEHPNVAVSLNSLALLHQDQGKYAEAEPLFQRALHIFEQQLGPQQLEVAASLNYLASLYYQQGKDVEAESLFQRALAIIEQQLGPGHLQMAAPLNNLALLYAKQGRDAEAESLYQQSLHIREQNMGPEHPDVAVSLTNLAILYTKQEKYAEAEPLLQRALYIWERQLGPEHPQVAHSLNGLAILYAEQGKYMEAEPLFQRALRLREQLLGSEHPEVARSLNNLAELYHLQGKYLEAEPLLQRTLRIWEQQLGETHPDLAYPLTGLANLYHLQGKYLEAELLLWRALRIREQQLGETHHLRADVLNNLAELYQEQGKYTEAEPLFWQALHIWEQQLGLEHHNVAYPLRGLAELYREQGKYAEAEPLYLRALALWEQNLGPDHPETAETLHDLATLREQQGHRKAALALLERALAIREQVLGQTHPQTCATRERLTALRALMSQEVGAPPEDDLSPEEREQHP